MLGSLTENALLGAWVAKEFKPIDVADSNIAIPNAITPGFTRQITKTFLDGAVSQTHTITLRFTCSHDASITRGNSGRTQYRVTIAGKSMSVPSAPNYNSSTESYLHVDQLTLRQTSIPNTAWIVTEVTGSAHGGSVSSGLSANFGINIGVLGASISVPLTGYGSEDINKTRSTYENYANHYVRSIKTELNSRYMLTQIEDYFCVESRFSDYGNKIQEAKPVNAEWDVTIINGSNYDTWTYTYPYTGVSIAIN